MEDSQEFNRFKNIVVQELHLDKRKMSVAKDENGIPYTYEASKSSRVHIMFFEEDAEQYYVIHETNRSRVVGVYDEEQEAVESFLDVIKKETYHIVYDMFLLLDKDDVGYITVSRINFICTQFQLKIYCLVSEETNQEKLTFEEFQHILVQRRCNLKELRDKVYDECHPKVKQKISPKIFQRISNYRQYRIKEVCSNDDKNSEHSKNYINAFIQIFEQAAEIADVISDIILAITIYRGGIVALNPKPYLILTVIFFVATFTPYILAYSSGIQLMIKKGTLNEDSYKRLGGKRKFMIGVLLTVFGPIFYIFLHLFDIFVDLCEGLGTLFLSDKTFSFMMKHIKTFQYSLGLNKMEYEGFLLQRKISQLMFESLSSFVLNILILSTPIFDIPDIQRNSRVAIYVSLATTVWNLTFQIFLLNLQSRYFQEKFLNYCLICMKARFGWIPFMESIEKNQLNKNIDYSNLRFTVPFFSRLFGIYLNISCEFSDVDIRNMKNAFESIKIKTGIPLSTPQDKLEIKMGRVLKNVSIDAIAQLLVSIPKEFNFTLNLNGISWHSCIKNKMKASASGKLVENWEPVLPTGEHLLKVCIDSENDKGRLVYYEMFVAILEEKANPNSFDLFGESLLYYAVKTRKIHSVKTLLKYEADPSIPNKFKEETPLVAAIANNDLEIIQILLEAGGDPHKIYRNKNNDLETPLMSAFFKWEQSKIDRDEDLLKFLKKLDVMAETQEERDMIFNFISKTDDEEYLKVALQFFPENELVNIKDSKNNNLVHCFFTSLTKLFDQPFSMFSETNLSALGSEINADGDEPGIIALRTQIATERIQDALSIKRLDLEKEKVAEIILNRLIGALEDPNKVELADFFVELIFSSEYLSKTILNFAEQNKNYLVLVRLRKSKGKNNSKTKDEAFENEAESLKKKEAKTELEDPKLSKLVSVHNHPIYSRENYPLQFLIPVMLQVASNRKYPVKRADFFERFMLCILELISLFDFVGDMIVLVGLAQTNNIGWTTLTIMSMLCPYLVSYAPLVTFFIERKRFRSSKSCWASTTKALMMTPVCIIYLIFLDILFIIFTVTVEPIELIFSAITCQRFKSLIDVDHVLDKILSRSFGLKIMDGKGFKRLRSISQLIFESIPQIVLQLRILSYGSESFGITQTGIIFSLGFAVLHTLIEFTLLTLESKATKSSLLYYSVVALNGRFNWVPFTEKFSSKGLNLDVELNYGKLRSRLCFSEFEITYSFSNESLQIFSNGLRYLPDVDREENRVIVRLGNTCDDDVSLYNINSAIMSAENKVNLDVEELDFDYFFDKEIKNELYPLAPDGEYLLIFYAEHGCGRAFLSLLKRGCKIDIISKKKNIPLASLKLPESIKKLVFEELIKAKDVNLIINFYKAEPAKMGDYYRKRSLEVADEYLAKGNEENALKLFGLISGFQNKEYKILPLIEESKDQTRLLPFYESIKKSLVSDIWFRHRKEVLKITCENAEVLKAFRTISNGIPLGYSKPESYLGKKDNPFDMNTAQLSEEEVNEMEKFMKDKKMKRLAAGCSKCGKEVKWTLGRYYTCDRCLKYIGPEPGGWACTSCNFDFCIKCYDTTSGQSKPTCVTCDKNLGLIEFENEKDIYCHSCRRTRTTKSYFGCSVHENPKLCAKCVTNIYDVS